MFFTSRRTIELIKFLVMLIIIRARDRIRKDRKSAKFFWWESRRKTDGTVKFSTLLDRKGIMLDLTAMHGQ